MSLMEQLWKDVEKDLKEKQLLGHTLSEFSNMSNNKERLSFVTEIPVVKKNLTVEKKYKRKDTDEAQKCRENGNSEYKKGDYSNALKCYIQSILYGRNKELALAFANISAVLFSMGKYKACLLNIDHAFEHGYPEESQYKLFDRKARCCRKIGDFTEAVVCVNRAIEHLGKSSLTENRKSKQTADLESVLGEITALRTESRGKITNTIAGKLPKVAGSNNEAYPCASDAFSILGNQEKGHYAVATRSIHVGEVIMVEKPYASILLPKFNLQFCSHCCRQLLTCVPCGQCAGVAFCSDQCRDVAWKSYHSIECEFTGFFDDIDPIVCLPLRIILSAGLQTVLDSDAGEDGSEGYRTYDNGEVCVSTDYGAIYNLAHHESVRSPRHLFLLMVATVILLNILIRANFFNDAPRRKFTSYTKKQLIVGTHLFRHMLLYCNSFAVYDYDLNVIQRCEPPTKIGNGYYTTLSLINHSCDPNAQFYTYGNDMVLRCFRPIKRDDKICIRYGETFYFQDKEARQLNLRVIYSFQCQCAACEGDWPVILRDSVRYSMIYLKCAECRNALYPEDQCKCRACGVVCDVAQVLRRMDSYAIDYKRFNVISLSQDGLWETRRKTKELMRLIEKHVVMPSPHYCELQEINRMIFCRMAHDYKE